MSELQSLKVEPSAEKEKQRSEAKHILLRKQRALADLFQHLAKTGKGLAWNLMQNDDQLLGVLENSVSDLGEISKDIWDGGKQKVVGQVLKCLSESSVT